jgi:hypothetical protein
MPKHDFMGATRIKVAILAIGIYFLPPLFFQIILVPRGIASKQIVLDRCGGKFRAADSDYFVSIMREYEGNDCVNGKSFVREEAASGNLGDVIGFLNSLLKYEVCFDQTTSLGNEDNVENSKNIELEKYIREQRELRIEDQSRNGFDIHQGECTEIPSWAQGKLDLKSPPWQRMDKALFEKLKREKYLTPSTEDASIYENRLFIEDTDITVRPKHIGFYIYAALTLAWFGLFEKIIRPRLKISRSKSPNPSE